MWKYLPTAALKFIESIMQNCGRENSKMQFIKVNNGSRRPANNQITVSVGKQNCQNDSLTSVHRACLKWQLENKDVGR